MPSGSCAIFRAPLWLVVLCCVAACGDGGGEQGDAAANNGLGIPSGTYAVDPAHAYLTFSYLHQGLSYPLIRATSVDGELELDARAIENSSTRIAVNVDSIRTNTPYFDKELASPKFFNAGKYPYITFSSQRYEATAEGSGRLHGLVTIRGISRPLTLDVQLNGAMENPLSGKPVIGFSAQGALLRSDFELDRFIPAVADEVAVRIEIEFVEGRTASSAAASELAANTVEGADAD